MTDKNQIQQADACDPKSHVGIFYVNFIKNEPLPFPFQIMKNMPPSFQNKDGKNRKCP